MMTPFQTCIKASSAMRKWAGERTAQEAWEQCDRPDWLLWWAAKAGVDNKFLIWVGCQCARRALHYVPAGEQRPLIAIETAERWCAGLATLKEVEVARRASSNYAYSAYNAHNFNSADAANAAASSEPYAYVNHVAYANANESIEAQTARLTEQKTLADMVRLYIRFAMLGAE